MGGWPGPPGVARHPPSDPSRTRPDRLPAGVLPPNVLPPRPTPDEPHATPGLARRRRPGRRSVPGPDGGPGRRGPWDPPERHADRGADRHPERRTDRYAERPADGHAHDTAERDPDHATKRPPELATQPDPQSAAEHPTERIAEYPTQHAAERQPEHAAERVTEYPAEWRTERIAQRRTEFDAERSLHLDADEHGGDRDRHTGAHAAADRWPDRCPGWAARHRRVGRPDDPRRGADGSPVRDAVRRDPAPTTRSTAASLTPARAWPEVGASARVLTGRTTRCALGRPVVWSGVVESTGRGLVRHATIPRSWIGRQIIEGAPGPTAIHPGRESSRSPSIAIHWDQESYR